MKHKDLILKLQTISPQLTFKKTTLEAALKAATEHSQWPRQLKPEELEDYISTVAARLKAMLRHVSQAKLKGYKWWSELLGEESPESPTGETERPKNKTKSKSLPEEKTYFYGFDAESKKASYLCVLTRRRMRRRMRRGRECKIGRQTGRKRRRRSRWRKRMRTTKRRRCRKRREMKRRSGKVRSKEGKIDCCAIKPTAARPLTATVAGATVIKRDCVEAAQTYCEHAGTNRSNDCYLTSL